MLIKAHKIHVQLDPTPQALRRLLRVLTAHEYIQRGAMRVQQVGRNVRADIARRSGQEYRHVAPLVPVFTVSSCVASCSWMGMRGRGGRTASGRPSISG